MTTMIALIGEQQLPNFLPIRHYSPTHVLLIYTKRTESHYEKLKAVLEQKLKIAVFGLETEPYNIAAITKKIHEGLEENEELVQAIRVSSEPPIFNLTGATKIMSLAAYQAAVHQNAPVIYLQSERGQSVLDLYSWRDHQLEHKSQVDLPTYLTLRDMLDLHIGRNKWGIKAKNNNNSDIGVLFELAIEQALKDKDYEVMCGITDEKNQIDIDVMMRHRNHIVIIEAKTKKAKKDHTFDGTQQLSTNMRYLGGTYTSPFLVTNYELSDEQKQTCKLMRIHPLSLPHYQQGMTTLLQKDRDVLIENIFQAIKPANREEKK